MPSTKQPSSRPTTPAVPLKPGPTEALSPRAMEDALAAAVSMPTLLTPRDVAEALAVSERTLERWRMTGEGPEYLRLTRQTVRYTAKAVNRFIAERARTNTAQL